MTSGWHQRRHERTSVKTKKFTAGKGSKNKAVVFKLNGREIASYSTFEGMGEVRETIGLLASERNVPQSAIETFVYGKRVLHTKHSLTSERRIEGWKNRGHEVSRSMAKQVIDALSRGRYNEDLRLARTGHKTIQLHFKDWYGVEWFNANFKKPTLHPRLSKTNYMRPNYRSETMGKGINPEFLPEEADAFIRH